MARIPLVNLERLPVYSCEQCGKAYVTEESLQRHWKWHEEQKYLRDPLVLKHFKSAVVKLSRVNIFQCGLCWRAFLEVTSFQAHQARDHCKKKKGLTGNNEVNGKIQNDDSNNNELTKPYKCSACGWRFVAESTLIAHRAVHAPKHECHCGIGYYKSKDLAAHRRLVHPTEKTWKPIIKYTGKKAISEFAYKQEPLSESEKEADPYAESESDYEPTFKKNGPKLKANLRIKSVKKKSRNKIKRERSTLNKENISGPPFQCEECPKSFLKLRSYKVHLIGHSDRAVKCPVCPKVFPYKASLEIHMRVHTGEKPYACTKCPKRFTQTASLSIHMKHHENLMEYKCEKCGKQFNNPGYLQRHILIHSELKPYVCKFETCSKRFADPSALARHLRIHTGELRYKCKHCPAAYTDVSAMVRHNNTYHEKKTFPCKICGKRLLSVTSRTIHMTTQHGKGKNQYYECDYCGKQFQVKNYLRVHIGTQHSIKERNFKCMFCEKSYFSRSYLSTHINIIHSKKYVYECDHCHSVFIYKKSLINHIAANHIGTPKLMYQCDYCSKKIRHKKNLLKHICYNHLNICCNVCDGVFYTPSELREHKCSQCTECNQYFSSKRCLNYHLKRMHVEVENSKDIDIESVAINGNVPLEI